MTIHTIPKHTCPSCGGKGNIWCTLDMSGQEEREYLFWKCLDCRQSGRQRRRGVNHERQTFILVNKVECEEENKRLKQRINLLQIAGDEAIKQRNDALRERDEARAENKRLREFLQKKPEPEKPDEDCPEDWSEEGEHDD